MTYQKFLMKLIRYVQIKHKKITNDLINDQIGISKEFNLFELQKSLGKKIKIKH